MKSKNLVLRVFTLAVSLLLIAAMALCMTSCGDKDSSKSGSDVEDVASTFAEASIKSKPEKLAKVLSIRYGEDTDDKEDRAEDMVVDEDTLEEYKFSYEIKDTEDVSSVQLKALKEYFDEEYDMKLSDAKIVKIKVTAKNKEDGDKDSNTLKLVFTKEKGGWKFFGYESELDSIASKYSEDD